MERRFWAFIAVIPLALGVLLAASSESSGGGSGSGSKEPPPPVHTATGFMLMRAGLDAEALAALGLSSSEVTAVVQAAEAHIATAPDALDNADDSYEQAKLAFDRLVSVVRSGRAQPAQITQCRSLCTASDTAEVAVQSTIDAIYEAGAAVLSPANQATLGLIRAGRDQNLAVYYLVKSRTGREWMDLHDAIDTRRISQRYGEPFPASAVQYLASAEGETAVATAKVNFETYIANAQRAWNAEVSN